MVNIKKLHILPPQRIVYFDWFP